MQCLQPCRDTKAELNRRGQACDFLTDTGISRRVKMVEHLGIAPSIPAVKAGVYLSTPMLGKWSPVRELHPPKRFCRPLPGLLGHRDIYTPPTNAESKPVCGSAG